MGSKKFINFLEKWKNKERSEDKGSPPGKYIN